MLTELDFSLNSSIGVLMLTCKWDNHSLSIMRRLKRHIRDQVLIMASFRSAKWSFLFHNSYIHILDVHMCYSKHKLS